LRLLYSFCNSFFHPFWWNDSIASNRHDCNTLVMLVFLSAILNSWDHIIRLFGLQSFSKLYSAISCYRAFHRFGQVKFPDGGSVLGSSQFTLLPQLTLKILLHSKVVKIDQKIILLLCKSKSETHSVYQFPYNSFLVLRTLCVCCVGH